MDDFSLSLADEIARELGFSSQPSSPIPKDPSAAPLSTSTPPPSPFCPVRPESTADGEQGVDAEANGRCDSKRADGETAKRIAPATAVPSAAAVRRSDPVPVVATSEWGLISMSAIGLDASQDSEGAESDADQNVTLTQERPAAASVHNLTLSSADGSSEKTHAHLAAKRSVSDGEDTLQDLKQSRSHRASSSTALSANAVQEAPDRRALSQSLSSVPAAIASSSDTFSAVDLAETSQPSSPTSFLRLRSPRSRRSTKEKRSSRTDSSISPIPGSTTPPSARKRIGSGIGSSKTSDSAKKEKSSRKKDSPISSQVDDKDILYQGWLEKRGKHVKNWKRRYCVLTKTVFQYYSDIDKSTLKGAFAVADVTKFQQIPKSKFNRDNCFALVTRLRTWYCIAPDAAEIEEWRQNLASVMVLSPALALPAQLGRRYTHGGRLLGEGGFSVVRLGEDLRHNETVAVKVISRAALDDDLLERVQREIKIMELLEHENIVQLRDNIYTAAHICLIMEYVSGVPLDDYMQELPGKRLVESVAHQLFYMLVDAVAYCHKQGIAHRDLKMENVMVCDGGQRIKLIDFGLGGFFGPNLLMKTHCGTYEYASPEMAMQKEYSGVLVDAWSLGVILYAMVVGYLPFSGGGGELSTHRLLSSLVRGYAAIFFPSHINPPCLELIKKALSANSARRIPVVDMLKHAWLAETEFVPDPQMDPEADNQIVKVKTRGMSTSSAVSSSSVSNDAAVAVTMASPRLQRNESSSISVDSMTADDDEATPDATDMTLFDDAFKDAFGKSLEEVEVATTDDEDLAGAAPPSGPSSAVTTTTTAAATTTATPSPAMARAPPTAASKSAASPLASPRTHKKLGRLSGGSPPMSPPPGLDLLSPEPGSTPVQSPASQARRPHAAGVGALMSESDRVSSFSLFKSDDFFEKISKSFAEE